MDWLKRNIGTAALIGFALGAFLAEIAGTLPEGIGADVTKAALIAMAAARGFVNAAEALNRNGIDQ